MAVLELLRGGVPAPTPREQRNDELRQLLEAARIGDGKALRTFLASIAPYLLRVARRVLGSQHPEVEDIAQEAAFQVVTALPRFEGRATVLHFVCRIALLTAMNARRREQAGKRISESSLTPWEDGTVSISNWDQEAALDQARELEQVRDLIVALPDPQGEALALHCVLGYTVPEIAEVAGVCEETVRSRLRAAKRSLRDSLMGAKPEAPHESEEP